MADYGGLGGLGGFGQADAVAPDMSPQALRLLMLLLAPQGATTSAGRAPGEFDLAQVMLGSTKMWTGSNSTPWDYNEALGYPGLTGRANSDYILSPIAQALMKQQADKLKK